jgi:endonuclease/exonuclease/phosphatase family metal-dependent hydrolase
MALAAIVHSGASRLVACSVHLESDTDHAGRARQMAALLDALDAYAPGLPVLIGGDLNTAVGPAALDDPREVLIAQAAARGYDWNASNVPGPSTRPSLWSPGAADRHLDWFCTRGLSPSDPGMVPAPGGQVLSDHDIVVLTVAPPPA